MKAQKVKISWESMDVEESKYDKYYGYGTDKGYWSSNFRKAYKEFPKDKVTERAVVRCLPEDAKRKWRSYSSRLSVPEKCVKLWTCAYPAVYKTVNGVLREDDLSDLREWMPYIRGLNLYIANHPTPRAVTTYRGSYMTASQQKNYGPRGSIVRIVQINATSTSKQVKPV